MRIISCLIAIVLYSSYLYANHSDPFTPTPSAQPKRVRFMTKYQYLGYIKGPNLAWAFIKPVGGDILRVTQGKSLGFGKVVSFTRDAICITRRQNHFCLQRAAQASNWIQVEALP